MNTYCPARRRGPWVLIAISPSPCQAFLAAKIKNLEDIIVKSSVMSSSASKNMTKVCGNSNSLSQNISMTTLSLPPSLPPSFLPTRPPEDRPFAPVLWHGQVWQPRIPCYHLSPKLLSVSLDPLKRLPWKPEVLSYDTIPRLRSE